MSTLQQELIDELWENDEVMEQFYSYLSVTYVNSNCKKRYEDIDCSEIFINWLKSKGEL